MESVHGVIYLPPDKRLEAAGDGTTRRIQRSRRAYGEVVKERNGVERGEVKRLLARLETLKTSLTARLLGGAVSEFRRDTLQALIRDVDREIERTQAEMAREARTAYDQMASLGEQAAEKPIEAAQVTVKRGLPGLDRGLVDTAFDNTVELLSQPMQQFGTDIKIALRQVALAGDSKMEAILRLRDRIAGAGFTNAEFRAERIIRTELGRVFEQSNYARLVELGQTFPFLRKYWRATADTRTRLGHVEAARAYPRGGGIAVGATFAVKVYDERAGKTPKLIGTASLRYPLDPQTTPAGRVAAGATILCRCGAVVDFDVADFAEYSAQQIQLALGGVKPPVASGPVPAVTQVDKPPVKRTRKPATVPLSGIGASGRSPVSTMDLEAEGSLQTRKLAGPAKKRISNAMALAARVHGVPESMPTIPVRGMLKNRTTLGSFVYKSGVGGRTGDPVDLRFTAKMLLEQPYVGVLHEYGHFLDYAGFTANEFASERSPLMQNFRLAVRDSAPMKTMDAWRKGTPGQGGVPAGVSQQMLDYMMELGEVWARAYAQYVIVKSGDAKALAELKRWQRASTTGDVKVSTPYGGFAMGTEPTPGTWKYPWQWSDDEFKPIEAAIDALMEGRGWRKRQ